MKLAQTNGRASSNVHSVGYDEELRTLAVCFLASDRKSPGATYLYADVPPDHFVEMMKDDVSTGSYLHQNVIKAGFKAKKIEVEDTDGILPR